MNLIRRSGSQLALLILGLLGAADAIYLTIAHYDDQVGVACPSTGVINCANVITSKYSYVPGTSMPITIPGLAWCLVIIALALTGLYVGAGQRWLRIAEFLWTLLGMLTVLYLIYAEIVLIRNICLWCTALHALILIMFLITLFRLRARPLEDEEDWEEEEEAGQVAPGTGIGRIER
jgi:uncharacterized membrane protein